MDRLKKSSSNRTRVLAEPSGGSEGQATILLRFKGINYLVAQPATLEAALDEAKRLFPTLDRTTAFLEKILPSIGPVRIDGSSWTSELVQKRSAAIPAIFEVKVKEETSQTAKQGDLGTVSADENGRTVQKKREHDQVDSEPASHVCEARKRADDGGHGNVQTRQTQSLAGLRLPEIVSYEKVPLGSKVQLFVKGLDGKTLTFEISLDDTVADFTNAIQEVLGIPTDQQRLIFAGKQLVNEHTLRACKLAKGAIVHLVLRLRGDKPVIYLFPPVPLPFVQVSLTLSPQWDFSALYPLVEISEDKQGESTVFWTVSAKQDGTLVDLASKTSLSYLFWEARSNPSLPSSSVPIVSSTAFDPSKPILDASNGCALPLFAFLPYLHKTLSSLSLHTSACNDFITFWLPSFTRIQERGQLVAFRFLPQSAYSQAAKLAIEPKPDVITRVFLLFRGVDASEADDWKKAREVDWAREVGIEAEKVKDDGLFRVLEWGGMEVIG
ncbi:hypothetical protein JCM10213_008128 [Rhodosporidiobolus nylandii]